MHRAEEKLNVRFLLITSATNRATQGKEESWRVKGRIDNITIALIIGKMHSGYGERKKYLLLRFWLS